MANKIEKRLDVLERLLNYDKSVHPPLCDCAIKSRMTLHHDPACPYRNIKEIIAEVRVLSLEDAK